AHRDPPRRHERRRRPGDPRAPPERQAPDGADDDRRSSQGRRARGSELTQAATDARSPERTRRNDERDATGATRQEGRTQVSIFVDETTKVVYQGLTGGQGSFYGPLNRDYGTQVVAGTSPSKAGTEVS